MANSPKEAGASDHLDHVSPICLSGNADLLNEDLILNNDRPIEFDSDCREGICGMCGIVINGRPHGPDTATTTCQLHMRRFQDGDTITIEPFRSKAFPVIRDLCVDRTALDRIMSAGGYTSARAGPHPDGNAILVPKHVQELAMEFAACIGCGACVASCPNASASLFTAAKISQLSLLPRANRNANAAYPEWSTKWIFEVIQP